MNKYLAIVLSVFAVMYFGALIIASGEVEFELPFASGEEGVNYIVELKDGIIIQSSLTTEHHVSHPSVGTIQVSDDGTTCWVTTERIGVLYYKITECTDNA